MPPARSTIRRWRNERPAFALLLAFARAVPKLIRKAKQAEREGFADLAATFRECGRAHCDVVFHVLHRVMEAGEDSNAPAFDREIAAYLKQEAKRSYIEP